MSFRSPLGPNTSINCTKQVELLVALVFNFFYFFACLIGELYSCSILTRFNRGWAFLRAYSLAPLAFMGKQCSLEKADQSSDMLPKPIIILLVSNDQFLNLPVHKLRAEYFQSLVLVTITWNSFPQVLISFLIRINWWKIPSSFYFKTRLWQMPIRLSQNKWHITMVITASRKSIPTITESAINLYCVVI